MENSTKPETELMVSTVISPAAFLEHWQGHRHLTRRVIDAFPEKELFNYSIGGMRPFAELAMEMIFMAVPGIAGAATGNWEDTGGLDINPQSATLQTKEGLLQLWDKVTERINTIWPKIQPDRFQEIDVAFGQYEMPVYATILYFIDNEIHHRGQGYVYLRSLGIQPPPFYER